MKFIVNISAANFDVAGVDRAELEKAVAAAVERAIKIIEERLDARGRIVRKLKADADQLLQSLKAIQGQPREVTVSVAVSKNAPFTIASPRPASRRAVSPAASTNGDLSRGQQKILDALAELAVLGVAAPSRYQLGMVAGYNLTGGTGAQHVADLASRGYCNTGNGVVQLTEDGRSVAVADDTPRTLDELHGRVLKKLSSGQRKIAEYLISIYPESISRADLGEAVGYNLTGGSGAQHVADLVTVGAATMPGSGKVVASDLLFPEGLS